ncbi:NAD-dependent epimerase/dehydratase family protein [Weissella diestrammenae]|uniref:NAD-dependent epimerase/dehydratase family protein n=1 Tax=Weissella diestrammenae TaxID=1162633 RepID=A0A7G9T4K7_9LACO|nr:NAD-dependent epimerase/dehydratase family protein [Weissella diestrammenae]MCM0582057.1 NAD-dependent epimerase/dehydratase family protein [Weissella diestrammenae]QNN75032.1 NAD-dependent epimerase/dehydratase family protein [Weissella diestrammenae]
MLIDNQQYYHELELINRLPLTWSEIDHHTFLIAGASGLIGSYLVDLLMQRNITQSAQITIIAVGRNYDKLVTRFSHYMNTPNFSILATDITNPITLNQKSDYIIHAASNTHPKAYVTDPIGTIMTNIVGTKNILDYAVKSAAKRTLFLSSVEIYGENRGDTQSFDEQYLGYIDSNTLRAGYPEAKRASESLVQAYIQKYQIDAIIPRLSRTFGPSMLMTDSKAASQFIKNAIHQEDIVLKSDGTQLFSYTYVADAVYALLYLLTNGVSGEAYNIADSTFNIQLKDLAKKIANVAHQSVIFDLPDQAEQKGFSKAHTAIMSSNKINALGWRPLFSLDTAIQHTIDILKNQA